MANDGDTKRRHTLADHLYGSDHDHVHDDGTADHDHDLGAAGPLEENPLWLHDNLSLASVGIDIGSAGTQVIFSRLHMRRLGEDLSSRYFVVARDTLYQSPVAFTPYVDDVRIDEHALGRIIDDAYQAAGLHPDQIDTGSVILTGEALRRENAQAIAELLAEMGGVGAAAARRAASRRRDRADRPQRPVLVRVGQEIQEVPRGLVATTPASEPTPQRLAAIRDQLKLLADYL